MDADSNNKVFPITEWDSLPLKAYEKILEEAKEHLNEHAAETESITDKSIKLLTIYVSFVSASGLYILSKDSMLLLNLSLGGFCLYVAWSILSVFKGHEVQYGGTKPADVLTSDFDNLTFTAEEKELLIYKNLIEQYIYKIKDMEDINPIRVRAYDNYLQMAIISVVTISFYIGFIL